MSDPVVNTRDDKTVTLSLFRNRLKEPFQTFRDNLHHELKRKGDLQFIADYITNGSASLYWSHGERLKAIYLCAMVDYLCLRNDLARCSVFDHIRGYSMKETVYVGDSILWKISEQPKDFHQKVIDNAIPEFRIHNIIEGDVDDVV